MPPFCCLVALVNLVELDLSFNRLTAIPDFLDRLGKLRRIHVHHNLLTTVPLWITKYHYGSLDLSCNLLSDEGDLAVAAIIRDNKTLKTLKYELSPGLSKKEKKQKL